MAPFGRSEGKARHAANVVRALLVMASSFVSAGPAMPAGIGFGDGGPADGAWTPLLPGRVAVRSNAYDAARSRILVWGAAAFTADVWALTLSEEPGWTLIRGVGAPPPQRDGASAIYDPVRDRLLMFGGRTDTLDASGESQFVYLNDVWALSLSGTPTWSRIEITGDAPRGRCDHAAIYDAARDRMVIYGGGNPYDSSDVWALMLGEDPMWIRLDAEDAPALTRTNPVAIYDPSGDQMVVVGADPAHEIRCGTDEQRTLWAFPLSGRPQWRLLSASVPFLTPRNNMSVAYDARRGRMVVFGGQPPCTCTSWASCSDGAWAFSFVSGSWQELALTGTRPSARIGQLAAYDAVRDEMVISGGSSAGKDLWALPMSDGSTWSSRLSDPPDLRLWDTGAYDPVRQHMLLFGGSASDSSVWSLSLGGPAGWENFAIQGVQPRARWGHTAICDPIRDRMLVFGGVDASYHVRGDVWALTLSEPHEWTELTPAGTPPAARHGHTATYDAIHDRMLVFGGQSGPSGSDPLLNDVWALSLSGSPAWTQLAPSGIPPAGRRLHSAIYDPVNDDMVIFGGAGSTWPAERSDTWALSLSGPPVWTKIADTGEQPAARYGHTAIYDPARQRMVVFGGAPYTGPPAWNLSLSSTPTWTALTPSGTSPGPRYGHVAVYDPEDDRMVISGSYGGFNDQWQLSWRPIVAPAPEPVAVELSPAAPNPMRDATVVTYALPKATRVRLSVLDVAGRVVALLDQSAQPAGRHQATWTGSDAGRRARPGLYFVRLDALGVSTVRRLVLVR